MATKKSLQSLTDKQFMSEWDRVAKEALKLKEQLKELSQEHQRRADEERARQALETMSDSQRAALVQMAQSEGIESQEAVNNG